MKYLPAVVFLMAVVVGDQVFADEFENDQQTKNEQSGAIYAHFFQRTHWVSLSHMPMKPVEGTPFNRPRPIEPRPQLTKVPPSPIVSFRVELGDTFELVNYGGRRFSGTIRREDDSFQLELNQVLVPQLRFKGTVVLDEIFAPQSTTPQHPAAEYTRIVFSRSNEVAPFLKLQAKIDAGESPDNEVADPKREPLNAQPDLPAEQVPIVQTKTQSNADESKTLYLHYFRPAVDHSFYVSPPDHFLTIKVHMGKLAEVIDWYSGRVSPQGNGYRVEINGKPHFGDYQFSGNVGLGDVIDLKLTSAIDESTAHGFFCCAVLSKSGEFEPILKAAAERAPVKMPGATPAESDDR